MGILFIEKNLCISRLMQFKPVLLKGQLSCIMAALENKYRFDLKWYTKISYLQLHYSPEMYMQLSS